jgi:putative ABC transport system permease protein
MIAPMIVRNLFHRKLRTLISVLAVGAEVALVVVMVGLTTGMLQETAKRIEGIGADIMLQPPSSSIFLAFSSAPMSIRIRDRLKTIEGVRAAAPVLLQSSTSGGLDVVYGIEPESFRAVSGGFVFHEGRELREGYEVLVDDWYAAARRLHVGDTLRLFGHDFTVVGVVEHGKGARLFVPIRTLQQLFGAVDKASLFFIKCVRAGQTPHVMEELRALFPRYEIRPLKDLLSMMTPSSLPGLDAFHRSMIALAVVIGFLVILLSMYTTTLERTREIGVLRALGASKAYIARIFLVESALLCAAGILAGVGLSYLAKGVLTSIFPTLSVQITSAWLLRAAAIALGAGLAGAAYPAWLASRRDPIQALAYE